MRKTFTSVMAMLLVVGFTFCAMAVEKKNPPSKGKREVAQILEKIGGEHNPEKMKVGEVGSVQSGETYYHIYCGTLKEGGYRVIIFDNKPKYLGYYEFSNAEPKDVGGGAVMMATGEVSPSGTPVLRELPIPEKGPATSVQVSGITAKFVPAPVEEKPVEEGGAAVPAGPVPEFREWHVKKDGRWLTVTAIFVEQSAGKVTIKSSKVERTATVPFNDLSPEDQEYVKGFMK